MAEVSPQEIRRDILNGTTRCVKELAALAVDTRFMGFEDPRSSAGTVLGEGESACRARYCTGEVRLAYYKEIAEFSGRCVIENFCLRQSWEDQEGPEVQDDFAIKCATQEVLSFTCPHANCGFNCGFTIDGGSGTAGECVRQSLVTETQVEVSRTESNG